MQRRGDPRRAARASRSGRSRAVRRASPSRPARGSPPPGPACAGGRRGTARASKAASAAGRSRRSAWQTKWLRPAPAVRAVRLHRAREVAGEDPRARLQQELGEAARRRSRPRARLRPRSDASGAPRQRSSRVAGDRRARLGVELGAAVGQPLPAEGLRVAVAGDEARDARPTTGTRHPCAQARSVSALRGERRVMRRTPQLRRERATSLSICVHEPGHGIDLLRQELPPARRRTPPRGRAGRGRSPASSRAAFSSTGRKPKASPYSSSSRRYEMRPTKSLMRNAGVAEHRRLGGHGLAVAEEERGARQRVVDALRRQGDAQPGSNSGASGFSLETKRRTRRPDAVDERAQERVAHAPHAAVVMGLERAQPHDGVAAARPRAPDRAGSRDRGGSGRGAGRKARGTKG